MRPKATPRKHQKDLGSAMLEFAVMAPILLILCIGVVDIGFMLNQYIKLTDVAREGARLASATPELVDPNPKLPGTAYPNGNHSYIYGAADIPESHDVIQARMWQLLDVQGLDRDKIEILTTYEQQFGRVLVTLNAEFDGILHIFDGMNIAVEQAAPYLYVPPPALQPASSSSSTSTSTSSTSTTSTSSSSSSKGWVPMGSSAK